MLSFLGLGRSPGPQLEGSGQRGADATASHGPRVTANPVVPPAPGRGGLRRPPSRSTPQGTPSPRPHPPRGLSWRPSPIHLARRKTKRGRTSRRWRDAGRASLQGSEHRALPPAFFLCAPRRGILFAIV